MRKLIAIALLFVFGLPFASALFVAAPKSESSLPACCRLHGRHQCRLSAAERHRLAAHERQVGAVPEKCPHCSPFSFAGHRPNLLGEPAGQLKLIGLTSQDAVLKQAQAQRRISQDRSRQKRGPPANLSL